MKSPEALTISVGPDASVTALVYRAESPLGTSLILAHGAGAGQRSPFIIGFADALAALGIDVVTFNFLYTEQHRRGPDRRAVLDACYGAVINDVRRHVLKKGDMLLMGGKSMGGRIATHVAAADATLPLAGLVLLGYPLHPPGRPHERRDAHLPDVQRPMLIVQGSRDVFGTPAEFDSLMARLSPRPTLHIVEGGDHSFKISRPGTSGQAAVYQQVQQAIAAWITRLK